jgi:hypothetical protein
MPIIIQKKIKAEAPVRKGRGAGFDKEVRKRALFIVALQTAGCRDIRELVRRLNDVGLTAPSGLPFSYGTLRRVLKRMKEMRLGPGTRTKKEARAASLAAKTASKTLPKHKV